jgi:uncharacterized cupredoxin-like copper-binding protein
MATKSRQRLAVAIGIGMLVLATGCQVALAATMVSVVLEDSSDGDHIGGMQLIPSPNEVKSGTITFIVENHSKSLVHEMLLLQRPASGTLPYDAKAQRIIENKTVKLVDTDDIQSNKSVTTTVRLRPGIYEMVCNQPGHFKQGMHATFTVTK